MITIHNLHVRYGKNKVLTGLNLEIHDCCIHGLVGLNGAGKTTLLNTLYGLKQRSEGEILYKSGPVKRKQIAYLETINYFYPRITGNEYLGLFKKQNPDFEIDKWNELFELPLDMLIDKYSNGMKRKLALMGIVSLNREILILDEPFNGLDMETVQKVKMLLPQLKSTKTILITSHILESLTNICDSISYLNAGVIQFTKDKKNFASLESEIFAVHHKKINDQIRALIGGR